MITHENIEIIHYFLQVDKALFKVMLAQLLAEYKAIHTHQGSGERAFQRETTFRKLCGTTSSAYGIGDGSA